MSDAPLNKRKNRRMLIILSLIACGMFAFGFAMVPLYNVLCNVLGINGKTNAVGVKNQSVVDKTRTITVQFLATNGGNLPWEFKPLTKTIDLHPGQSIKVAYFAQNDSNETMTVQAIPSVTPTQAASHLKKTECFCFNQQTLKAHQSMDMPIIFHLDNDLPKNIKEITLSYTLFKFKGS